MSEPLKMTEMLGFLIALGISIVPLVAAWRMLWLLDDEAHLDGDRSWVRSLNESERHMLENTKRKNDDAEFDEYISFDELLEKPKRKNDEEEGVFP